MVVQSTLNNLKEKPHDEKKAVASSIAIGVVILLLVGWDSYLYEKFSVAPQHLYLKVAWYRLINLMPPFYVRHKIRSTS